MWPKCLKCSQSLSLSWLLGSFNWTKHRCVNCKALHEFTIVHRVASGLFVAAVILSVALLKPYIESYSTRFLLAASVMFLLLSFVPGQYKLSSKN